MAAANYTDEQNYNDPTDPMMKAMLPGDDPTDPQQQQPSPQPGGFDRIKFRDALFGQKDRSTAGMQQFVASHPDFATGVQVGGAQGDKLTLPGFMDNGIFRGPENIDATIDAGGANKPGWTGDFGSRAVGAGSVGAGGAPGSGAGASGGGAQDAAIHDALMRLLGRGEAPVSDTDPSIQAQFAPISRAIQQGSQRTRMAAAERMAQQGTNSGGTGGPLDAEINSINENAGQQEGAAMGNLVGSELAGRRADVANALQFAQGEQKISLQKQLQDMDAQLKSRGLDLQGRQLDLQGQGLGQQNQQFYDRQAFDYADLNNRRDDQLARLLYQ